MADPFLVFLMIIMDDDICFLDLFDGKSLMGKTTWEKLHGKNLWSENVRYIVNNVE